MSQLCALTFQSNSIINHRLSTQQIHGACRKVSSHNVDNQLDRQTHHRPSTPTPPCSSVIYDAARHFLRDPSGSPPHPRDLLHAQSRPVARLSSNERSAGHCPPPIDSSLFSPLASPSCGFRLVFYTLGAQLKLAIVSREHPTVIEATAWTATATTSASQSS